MHLENYIFENDRVGRRFAAALSEKAREGVAVRVLYDWFGCADVPRSFWGEMRRAGVEVRAVNPPSLRRGVRSFVRRDHRKLVGVDGAYASVDGICIADGLPRHGSGLPRACRRGRRARLRGGLGPLRETAPRRRAPGRRGYRSRRGRDGARGHPGAGPGARATYPGDPADRREGEDVDSRRLLPLRPHPHPVAHLRVARPATDAARELSGQFGRGDGDGLQGRGRSVAERDGRRLPVHPRAQDQSRRLGGGFWASPHSVPAYPPSSPGLSPPRAVWRALWAS